MKQTHGTATTKGLINHMRHPDLGILMPVKLVAKDRKIVMSTYDGPRPLERDGKYVYALPAGQEYVA